MKALAHPLCLLCAAAMFWTALFAAGGAMGRVIDGGVIIDQRMGENLCALTFDDGPSAFTPKLLDMLDEYGIRATFFMLGKNAELHPQIVRRVLAEGHEVGNHSYSHANLCRVSPERQDFEIRATDAILRKLGANPLYMRPPYGNYDQTTENIANSLGVSLVLWSLDSHDWKILPADYAAIMTTRGFAYPHGGLRGVFLFHDIHKRTVEDLPRIIAQLRAGGCQRFVTMSDYLDGLLDPEPGQCMTRREPHPAEVPPMRARAPERVPAMRAWPAGTAPIPMARSSRPWKTRPASEPEHALDSVTAPPVIPASAQPQPGAHPAQGLPETPGQSAYVAPRTPVL